MRAIAILAMLAVLASGQAIAQSHDSHHAPEPAPATRAGVAPMADGEVRRVDKEAGKITLKHGPIRSLDMPPMTMVFQVHDRAFLEKVKAGDKVKFTAEEKAGAYVVTSLEAAK